MQHSEKGWGVVGKAERGDGDEREEGENDGGGERGGRE